MIEIIGTELNQWDVGRSVTVTDTSATHVHFANTGDSKAVIMEFAEGGVNIPDFLLQTGKQLCVYAVANGVTVERKTFPVRKRERPENYVYDDDQRNYIYELIKAAEDAAANNVGRTTAAGGEIFGDYEKNEANAEYATAFGTENKAHGVASFASGAKQQHETDTPYPKDENGNEIIPDDAWRYNEAVGTASTAMGMGNVAFSRASKAFGFRTQTGRPPSVEWFEKRPELLQVMGAVQGDGSIEVYPGGSSSTNMTHTYPILGSVLIFEYSATKEESGDSVNASIRFQFKKAIGGYTEKDHRLVTDGEIQVVKIDVPSGYTEVHVYWRTGLVNSGSTVFNIKNQKIFFCDKENRGQAAVALGADTAALGNHAIAGGWRAIARGAHSFALGSADTYSETPTEASGYGAVAIGKGAKASGSRSVAMGVGATSSGKASVALGDGTTSTGQGSFAVGVGCTASNYTAFACGEKNTASAYNAFAGGSGSVASHANAVAIGRALKTGKGNHAVFGQYNDSTANTDSLLTVGKGTSDSTRSNAFDVKSNGNILVGGKSVHSGADYAEFFEWTDGNPNAEDRIGLIVALDGEKVRPAMPGDDVLGIVSGTAAVLGDSAAMYWKDKYLTDEFGRTICDMVEEFIELPDPETGEMVKESTGLMPQPRLNPNFDPDSTYIPREARKEWDQIGMMGKLYVRDDGTLAAGDYGCPGENGVLTKSDSKTNIRVMKRTGDNIVLVLLK